MPVILEDVSVVFSGRAVLSAVNIELTTGVTAISGPSGAGKSTLMSVIAGRLAPTAGRMRYEGLALRPAWVLQSAPVLGRRSALANVMLGPLATGQEEWIAYNRGMDALKQMGIAQLADSAAFTLSGGERQRVAMARAIASDAQVVLADEPTASLDPKARDAVCGALEELARGDRIVVVATHDPYVRSRAARAIALDDGRVVDGEL